MPSQTGPPSLEEIVLRLKALEEEVDMLRAMGRTDSGRKAIPSPAVVAIEEAAAFLQIPLRAILTEDEAIEYLRLDTIDIADSKATMRRYREKGLLRGTQVSKRIFYRKEELDAFLRRLTEQNPR